MDHLLDVYLFCGGFGFVWIIATACFGFTQVGSNSGDAGDVDTNVDAGGDLGGADASGADASGDLGNIDTSSGDAGADAAGDMGNIEAEAVASYRSGLMIRKKRLSPFMLLLKIISPSTITTFMFFFGLAGYLSLHTWPFLGALSLIIAVIASVVGYKLTSAYTGMIVSKMHVSTSYTHEQLIGHEAEVSVLISPGRVGEVTVLANGIRQTAPAKGLEAQGRFPSGSKVVIADIRDGMYFVEPS